MSERARVLVTGSAGFIGFHVSSALLQGGAAVLGVDNFNPYYDVGLKERRNELLASHDDFSLARLSIEQLEDLEQAWRDFRPNVVVHLAAQAGVRYSIDHPEAYISTNLIGTFNVLELARRYPVKHLLAASTSSVYGANRDMPFHERQRTATPISLYAATKGATELMGHSYSSLYRIPMTFLRFFTVYGPWGRPDMALFRFARAICRDEAIDVYNNGEMVRDFTYVGDLATAVVHLIDIVPGGAPVENDSLSPVAPFRIVNIGGGNSTQLMDYIAALERAIGKEARKNMMPLQKGDVPATEASPDLLRRLIGFAPATPIEEGVASFFDWYRAHCLNGP
jgi:UDP-glucuronate 4-epimerase